MGNFYLGVVNIGSGFETHTGSAYHLSLSVLFFNLVAISKIYRNLRQLLVVSTKYGPSILAYNLTFVNRGVQQCGGNIFV